jgi:hypothetical protein
MWNTAQQELAQADDFALRAQLIREAFPQLAEILQNVETAAGQKAKAMQQLERVHDIIEKWTIE